MTRLLLMALAAVLLVPAAAGAQTRSVTTFGSAQATPDFPDKATPDQIQAAIEAAEAEALPKALDAARKRADILAKAAGATLGDVISIEELAGGGGPHPFAFPDRPALALDPLPAPFPLAIAPCTPARPPRSRGKRRRALRCPPLRAPGTAARLKVTFALK